ncbi:hypothetical protein [Phocaeicola vulgatus]|uniref:hypothetical protein n=1 Tax=Phocaeicola vulgatus TaxID=821 RepID=UPI0034A2F2FD
MFPSVACSRYRTPFKRMAGSGKVFGPNRSNLFGEDFARNGITARPCLCHHSHTLPLHPCIGNKELAEWASTIP